MKISHMVAAELRRLVSTPMLALALFALLCVPILYGGFYLWANQNPYDRLAEIPAAVIVLDQGAEIDGSQRNLGEEISQELLKSNTFDWTAIGEKKGEAGLIEGRFEFAIVIPKDFSADIASITGSDPERARIQLRTNDANNYLASTIGTQAVQRVQTVVAEKVVTTAAEAVLAGLAEIRAKLAEAASGASQLVSGLGTAGSGVQQLRSGAQQLADGTVQLRDGAQALASGSAQVAAGVRELDGIADEAGSLASAATARLPQLESDITQVLTDAGLSQAQIDQALAALAPVGDRIRTLDDRLQNAVGRIDELAAGADEVASGSSTLASGLDTATSGAGQLVGGVDQLGSGIGELATGAGELATGLQDGVAQVPDDDEATRQRQSAVLADPVRIDTSALAQAQNYGAGLAPFFAALAAWIGIYALFLIVKPVSRRALSAMDAPVRVTIAGWLTPALLGAVQMLGLFGVLSLALGFRFANPLAVFGLLVLASASYTWIILALNVWLGAVGQFLGLVLMVLQLVTAGGTFPWQTLPPPLAALHEVLPMGFVVDALRQVMYGGDISRVWTDIGVVLLWAAVAAVAALAGVVRMTRFFTLRDLQPSIIQ
ncbi:YhgE/Pip domain-containing protein [Microbacterium sp. zg.B48]|uniref:YhgE/Pip domain-containing protein n=1 Tax=unclassified Microbacterium TaxID=2609290 RepID=UPI00214BF4F9|nr:MULTISPECIES: YhgE/Pip domain-containing protein [unclassified Microbacterium]MCR2764819.1 YhgE/Pip domain-containing protein [Microbacterium sp. zg.B48]MCR2810043.1 YhgE/Pip domain-containing protein [Microbacterium sp. zg.B185]WIM20117.1 YhgE/Pip domain-containing protein [Microbacterium sp. zg-B185]